QVVEEVMKVARECGAEELHIAADWSAYARRREERLQAACEEAGIGLTAHPGVTILDPGAVTPTGGAHFKVFSPYHRAWSEAPWREAVGAPRKLSVPADLAAGELPALEKLTDGTPSPDRPPGGETEARKRMQAFFRDRIANYDDGHDDLPNKGTSHISADIRWGCVSPLELAVEAREARGGGPFVRQLCWRDFHHQVLADFPELPRRDYRPRGDRWSRPEKVFEAWREGRTGYPLVDAGMRQLAAEGYMHNRARMTVGSFLTKDLYVDWRKGAWHFWDLLCDGEIANNAGLRAPLGARAGVGARQGDLPALADGRLRGARLPRADRRPRRRRRRVPHPPRSLTPSGAFALLAAMRSFLRTHREVGDVRCRDGTAGRHPRLQRARSERR
ncbi:MAG: deoxyribodipyrimidine photo-lyase, partial [Actinobacteria bacterium]|nr:deoxyribodipyrimidine photo-lyase [Actinomycetota bacterium]